MTKLPLGFSTRYTSNGYNQPGKISQSNGIQKNWARFVPNTL